MNATIRALLSSGALVASLSACATATEAANALTTDTSSRPTATRGSDADGSAEPEVETRTSFEVGEAAEVGDWVVTVTKVTRLTPGQVKAWDSSNDRPRGQYVMARYAAQYVGPEHTADVSSELSWAFIGSDGQVHEPAPVRTAAHPVDAPSGVAPGGTVQRKVVFDVPVAAVEGGVVTVEGYDEQFNTLFAEFAF
ncbi:hypothetical protein GCM10023168_36000 [Fodinibacter luteus]|uniref:DUF4352 domain-containing protein n=1 Tax=Fodinibacter luteus TaxID=552064 RepID=A0ABP8KS91_9MICO